MLLEIIAILAVIGLLTRLLYLKYDHWRYSHLPGPPRQSFIFGNSAEFRKRTIEDGSWGPWWLEMSQEYGVIFQYWIVMKPLVFVSDPLVLKEMVTDFKIFPKIRGGRGFFARRFVSFDLQKIGTQRMCGYNSILTDDGGPIWRRKKKVMDPAFSTQNLAKHLSKFYNIATSLCEAINTAQLESPGEPVDVSPVMGPFTVDAISRAGFSVPEEEVYKLRLKEAQSNLRKGIKNKNMLSKGGDFIKMIMCSELREMIFTIIADAKKIRKIGAELIMDRISNGQFGHYQDILDCIIKANMNEGSGELELEESLDDFMAMYAAGNATTSTSLFWSLGQLTRNPEVMEKLVEEIDSVWVAAGIDNNTDVEVIGETLKSMTYLEAFVKEVLRYHPPVQHINRTCSKQVELCGYTLPSYTNLMSSQYVIHHSEKNWENPEQFDPDRFITSTPKPYTYIPFFLGPRQCIGKNFALLELKCFLCEILSRFDVEKDPDTPWKQRSSQALLCFPTDNSYTFKSRH